jgi:hypothetical protein
MVKHFVLNITDDRFTFARNTAKIDAEAALDGVYVGRTTVAEVAPDQTATVSARSIYRDPVRSSKGHFVKASGLRRLSAMLLVKVPWADRVMALPFLTPLAPLQTLLCRRDPSTQNAARLGAPSRPTNPPLASRSRYFPCFHVVSHRHWTPLRLSRAGCSRQFGRASAPMAAFEGNGLRTRYGGRWCVLWACTGKGRETRSAP